MSTKPVILSEQSLRRFQAGDLILRGYGNDEIIDILEVSLASVKRWRKSVESVGLQALSRKFRTDYSKKLDDSKRHELEKIIRDGARASGYLVDRWTSRMVADLIRKKWGIDYSCSHVRRILHSLNLSCQKPDVEAAEHSTEAVKYWRHYVWPSIKKKRTKTVTSWFSGTKAGFPSSQTVFVPGLLSVIHRFSLKRRSRVSSNGTNQ